MNAQLLAEVQAWIADDPDPKTAAELTKLVADGDEATLNSTFVEGRGYLVRSTFLFFTE